MKKLLGAIPPSTIKSTVKNNLLTAMIHYNENSDALELAQEIISELEADVLQEPNVRSLLENSNPNSSDRKKPLREETKLKLRLLLSGYLNLILAEVTHKSIAKDRLTFLIGIVKQGYKIANQVLGEEEFKAKFKNVLKSLLENRGHNLARSEARDSEKEGGKYSNNIKFRSRVGSPVKERVQPERTKKKIRIANSPLKYNLESIRKISPKKEGGMQSRITVNSKSISPRKPKLALGQESPHQPNSDDNGLESNIKRSKLVPVFKVVRGYNTVKNGIESIVSHLQLDKNIKPVLESDEQEKEVRTKTEMKELFDIDLKPTTTLNMPLQGASEIDRMQTPNLGMRIDPELRKKYFSMDGSNMLKVPLIQTQMLLRKEGTIDLSYSNKNKIDREEIKDESLLERDDGESSSENEKNYRKSTLHDLSYNQDQVCKSDQKPIETPDIDSFGNNASLVIAENSMKSQKLESLEFDSSLKNPKFRSVSAKKNNKSPIIAKKSLNLSDSLRPGNDHSSINITASNMNISTSNHMQNQTTSNETFNSTIIRKKSSEGTGSSPINLPTRQQHSITAKKTSEMGYNSFKIIQRKNESTFQSNQNQDFTRDISMNSNNIVSNQFLRLPSSIFEANNQSDIFIRSNNQRTSICNHTEIDILKGLSKSRFNDEESDDKRQLFGIINNLMKQNEELQNQIIQSQGISTNKPYFRSLKDNSSRPSEINTSIKIEKKSFEKEAGSAVFSTKAELKSPFQSHSEQLIPLLELDSPQKRINESFRLNLIRDDLNDSPRRERISSASSSHNISPNKVSRSLKFGSIAVQSVKLEDDSRLESIDSPLFRAPKSKNIGNKSRKSRGFSPDRIRTMNPDNFCIRPRISPENIRNNSNSLSFSCDKTPSLISRNANIDNSINMSILRRRNPCKILLDIKRILQNFKGESVTVVRTHTIESFNGTICSYIRVWLAGSRNVTPPLNTSYISGIQNEKKDRDSFVKSSVLNIDPTRTELTSKELKFEIGAYILTRGETTKIPDSLSSLSIEKIYLSQSDFLAKMKDLHQGFFDICPNYILVNEHIEYLLSLVVARHLNIEINQEKKTIIPFIDNTPSILMKIDDVEFNNFAYTANIIHNSGTSFWVSLSNPANGK